MKKVLLFAGGFISGVITVIIAALLYNASINSSDDKLPGLTLFPEKGECIETGGELKVIQVIEQNVALARSADYSNMIVVLLINHNGISYYDDQRIKIPENKCPRQIGIYNYSTNSDKVKTVPAVVIE